MKWLIVKYLRKYLFRKYLIKINNNYEINLKNCTKIIRVNGYYYRLVLPYVFKLKNLFQRYDLLNMTFFDFKNPDNIEMYEMYKMLINIEDKFNKNLIDTFNNIEAIKVDQLINVS